MEVAWQVLGGVLVVVGIVGCVVPVVPGPVVAYCGLLCLLPTSSPPSVSSLVAFGLATAVASVLDSVVPAMGAKRFNCSKWGVAGCFVGTFVGVFFFPAGLLAGPFLGALAGELVAGRGLAAATRGGVGAFLGFLAGVAVKLAACAAIAAWFARSCL